MLKEDEENLYCLALTQIPKIGPVTARNIIAYAGGAKKVFDLKAKQLQKIPRIGRILSKNISDSKSLKWAENQLKSAAKRNIKVLSFLGNDYPTKLKNIHDAPIILFAKGNLNPLVQKKTIGIVGTRRPSHYGISQTKELIAQSAQDNFAIVSGLAFGIDSLAHRAACEINLPNYAVLGHGIDQIYPKEHLQLSKKIASCGALISEFPIGQKPAKEHFPMRNRIIAGLSDAVVVVESGIKGGSLITAKFANQYHRDVFAVPGPINASQSKGCNNLIRSNLAHIYTNINDICYHLGIEKDKSIQQKISFDFSNSQQKIISLLEKNNFLAIDDLQTKLNEGHTNVFSDLLSLELKGIIRQLPGKKFTLS